MNSSSNYLIFILFLEGYKDLFSNDPEYWSDSSKREKSIRKVRVMAIMVKQRLASINADEKNISVIDK